MVLVVVEAVGLLTTDGVVVTRVLLAAMVVGWWCWSGVWRGSESAGAGDEVAVMLMGCADGPWQRP